MRRFFLFAALAAMMGSVQAQEVEYIDDEECGCELVFVDGIQTTSDGELFGFKRADGSVIAPNIYRFVDQFHGDYCKVYEDYGRVGLIDREGRTVLPCIYQELDYPSEGRILVVKGGRYGYTDMNGTIVIEPQYLMAGTFHEGMAPVQVTIDSFFTACTFIDTLGRVAFETLYETVQPFNEGLAPVKRYQRWGMIDMSGKEVLTTRYELITNAADGIFFAGDESGMAMFDYTFRPLTEFVYTWTSGYCGGRIGVQRDGRYGFLDRQGHEVIPCIYDETGLFVDNRTLVARDGKYGIIDTNGTVVLPLEYENQTPHGEKYVYYDGLALVEKDGKLGYVDIDGKLVIPMYFDQAFHFTEGLACTRFNGRWGYIDTKGDVFVPHIFEHASPMELGRAEVIYNGKVSKMDRRGKCVKNCNGVIAWRDF